jgi:two-component system chemotaxis response regulator CheB
MAVIVRPTADLLFESEGTLSGRSIGVVLTGTGCDGTMGVGAIAQTGGTVIAQDPQTAEFAGMAQAVIDLGFIDFILNLGEMGPALLVLANATSMS